METFIYFLENDTIFQTVKYSDAAQPIVIFIMSFYLLVANVVLLNILIAVFK